MTATSRRPVKVGLYLQNFENLRTRVLPSWRDMLEIAQHAEAVGFDSIWVGDHLYVKFPSGDVYDIWEGWSLLSALAATTSRMDVGTLVAATNFRNPALLAKMAVTVDEISGGRLILGVGTGWHEPDFRAFGFPFDHRASRFEEALIIITTLLRTGEIDFHGQYYDLQECELRPRGPRESGPPVVVGAIGERMLHLAARHADGWNRDATPEGSIAELPLWRDRVDAACRAEGRDPRTLVRYALLDMDLPGAPPAEGSGATTGSPDELADVLMRYAEEGIHHVQVRIEPQTPAGIEAFARTLEILDGAGVRADTST